MTSLTHLGLNHRTKLMDAARAGRFARCLAANSRFTNVQTVQSRSEGKFFVTYQPSSDLRYREVLFPSLPNSNLDMLGRRVVGWIGPHVSVLRRLPGESFTRT